MLAAARLLYANSRSPGTKDAILGEALDPLNMMAVLGLYGFGAMTILLLFVCFAGGMARFFGRAQARSEEETTS